MGLIDKLLNWTAFWRQAGGGFLSSLCVHIFLLNCLAWFVITHDKQYERPTLIVESVPANEDVQLETLAQVIASDETAAAATAGGSLPLSRPGLAMVGESTAMPGLTIEPMKQSQGGKFSGFVGLGLSPDKLLNKVGERSASFFGLSAAGDDFIFIVDISGSMRQGDRIRRAIAELRRSISKLASPQRFYIIFFSDTAYRMPGNELVEPTKENLLRVHEWINKIVPLRNTNPLPALQIALDMKPSAIFLLSDGEFDAEGVLQEIYARSTGDMVPIHTIAFESLAGAPMLQIISRQSKGQFRFVAP